MSLWYLLTFLYIFRKIRKILFALAIKGLCIGIGFSLSIRTGIEIFFGERARVWEASQATGPVLGWRHGRIIVVFSLAMLSPVLLPLLVYPGPSTLSSPHLRDDFSTFPQKWAFPKKGKRHRGGSQAGPAKSRKNRHQTGLLICARQKGIIGPFPVVLEGAWPSPVSDFQSHPSPYLLRCGRCRRPGRKYFKEFPRLLINVASRPRKSTGSLPSSRRAIVISSTRGADSLASRVSNIIIGVESAATPDLVANRA